MTKHCNCKPVFSQIIQVCMRWSPFVLLIIEQLLKSNTLFQVPIVISENGSLQLPSHAFNFLTAEPFFQNLLKQNSKKEGRGNGNVVQPMVVKHEWSYLHYHYHKNDCQFMGSKESLFTQQSCVKICVFEIPRAFNNG